ncbi:hypothetical protein Btru_036331 [Bulinus truncatus]|nr:hypothetical protein Btru_036331 [Bulinus truncatus]
MWVLLSNQKKYRFHKINKQSFSSRKYRLPAAPNTACEPVMLLNSVKESCQYTNCPTQPIYSNVERSKESGRFVSKGGLNYVTVDHSETNIQQRHRVPTLREPVTYTTVRI